MRIAGTLVAVVVAAWFALGAWQAHYEGVATRAIDRGAPAEAALDRAAVLSPTTDVAILRARQALAQGRPAEAWRRFFAVTDREPDNFDAWLQLAVASSDTDHRVFSRAAAELRRLAPLVPEP